MVVNEPQSAPTSFPMRPTLPDQPFPAARNVKPAARALSRIIVPYTANTAERTRQADIPTISIPDRW